MVRLQSDRHQKAAIADHTPDGQEGYVVSAVLGLLALMLGFTLAMAVDRYETRRALVLEEANAIGTTYLRAQLFGEPHRARLSKLLVEYNDNRLALALARRNDVPTLLEPIRKEVNHAEAFAARRLSMILIMASRMKATTVEA